MRFTEIALKSANLAAQRDFYHDRLDFPVLNESPRHITLKAGGTRLTFEQSDDEHIDIYHFAFNIPHNQFPEAKAWLGGRATLRPNPSNPTTSEFDFRNWNAHAMYFYDADGNIVEFIARHNLDNASKAPFSQRSILGVSEIGLPTPDVRGTVQGLQSALGVGVYSGGDSDTFRAVGDEHGLLIIVEEGRTWLATDVPARPMPLAIKASDAPRSYDVPALPYHIAPPS